MEDLAPLPRQAGRATEAPPRPGVSREERGGGVVLGGRDEDKGCDVLAAGMCSVGWVYADFDLFTFRGG